MGNLKSKVIGGLKWSLIETVLSNIISVTVLIYLARLLKPEYFGLIGMLAIFTALTEVILSSGLSQALIQKNKNVGEEDYATVFTISLFIGLLLYLIMYISAPYIAGFYDKMELVDIIRVLFLIVIFNVFTLIPKAKLCIDMKFKAQAFSTLLGIVLSSVTAILLASTGADYWALVAIPLVKSVVNSICLSLASRWVPKFGFHIGTFEELFSYGGRLLLAGIINVLTLNMNSVLIGKFLGTVSLGYYSQSRVFSGILSDNIAIVTQKVTFPLLSSIRDEREQLLFIYKKVVSLSVFLSFPILFGFASISKEFVTLFLGDKWLPMVPILIFLCISKSITPISRFNINAISALGYSNVVLKIDFLKFPISLLILMVSIEFGVIGVAIGHISIEFLFFLLNSSKSASLFNLGTLQQLKLIYKFLFSALIMFFINLNLNLNLDSIFLLLMVKILLGVGVYLGCCFLMKVEVLDDLKVIIKGLRY